MVELVDWPTLAALKRMLDIPDDNENFDEELSNALEAGIERVKSDVGDWGGVYAGDFPDGALANAALRAAILLRPNAEPGVEVGSDLIYRSYLTGKRRRFAIS